MLGTQISAAAVGVALALALGGCVTRPLNFDPQAAVDPATKGLLLVGVEPQSKSDDLGKVSVQFYVRAENQGARYPDVFSVASAQVVWVLPLSPGEYSISDWYQSASVANRVSTPTKYTFRIVAGEATYIGTIEAFLQRRENLIGMRVVPSSSMRVRDQRERDLAQFRARFPTYQDWHVRFEVSDGFAWSGTTPIPEAAALPVVK
jgi:hypothetical protein